MTQRFPQALDASLAAAACSAGHLLRAHDDSIWNSSSAAAVLSPLFQLDCARSLAHNDVCGLVCDLKSCLGCCISVRVMKIAGVRLCRREGGRGGWCV